MILHRLVPVAAVLLLAACLNSSLPAPVGASPAAPACGDLTKLIQYPSAYSPPWRGAPVGPLFLTGFDQNKPGAELAAGHFVPGYPTKMGVAPLEALTAPVTLAGWQCGTRERVRFWMKGGAFPLSLPASREQLAAVGNPAPTFGPTGPWPKYGLNSGWGGYVTVWGPGMYLLMASQEGRVLGSAVFLIPA